ncbi:MAG: glycosyl hydrolase 53 family protein, partial [Muribaculaceae bacterium]|nr:glycosyl hydrolase 53 family protein [Muribaculaceae bacterium]
VLTFFKSKGMNSMRVRLFVNPENASDEDKREGVRQDLDYVKELGKRIKKAGLKFALDMHYSDTWADPGQQATPSAWSSLSVEQLANQVYNYTCEVLDTLKSNGAVPDLIQIGNETTYGMLWPSGRCYPSGSNYGTGTWANYAAYINNGIKAVREKCPSAKIILHTELHNTTNVINFYRQLKNRAIDYDVIGLSYYPDYHGNLNTLNTVLNNLENTFPDKAIMIMETGYGYAWQLPGATNNYTSTYPLTEAGQRKLLSELISTLNKHNNVKGLFWWWPEANEYGINYTNAVTSSWWNGSLFNNNNGKALKALEEFQNF